MDTLTFFRRVLPESGAKILAEPVQAPGQPRPRWRYQKFQTIEAAAEAALRLDAAGRTVYHACNSFGDWYEEDGKQRLRTQKNVVACRALYDDIDVGKEGCYATKREAGEAVKQFAKAVGLTPLIVDSGGGIHLYWPLTEDITPTAWQHLAGLKRQATRHFGLKVDPAVDVDSSRVLRPVGTHNRKRESEREVKAVLDAGPYTPGEVSHALSLYIEQHNLDALTSPRPGAFAGLFASNDLAAREYPDSSLAIVAQHCKQIDHFRQSGGDVEPEWYAALGVAKHCSDGHTLAQKWSANYAGYSAEETEAKFDQWNAGPTTCAQFRALRPALCEGCTHGERIKSPIQLGYAAESAPPVIEAPAEQPGEVEEFVPQGWPARAKVIDDVMHYAVKDETGVVAYRPFASPLFYPIERIRAEDGTYMLRFAMQVRKGRPLREFDIPTKALADSRALRSALGAYEILITNDKLAAQFMNDYASWLRKVRDEKNTFLQLGWHNDYEGFLVGDHYITASEVSQVRLSEKSIRDPDVRSCYRVSGTAEEWVAGVHELYGAPGLEPYQYTIATVFGSVLVPLLGYDQWNGIPLALTTDVSGYGKSTVAIIAINALYHASRAAVTNTTAFGVVGRASNMGNLTVLFDDALTSKVDSNVLSDMLYALSNGRQRVGMQSDGSERAPRPPFKLNSIVTGNRNLVFQLTEASHNPEATQMRVFEIDLMSYYGDTPPFDCSHNEKALYLANNVTGALAVPYIQYVIANRTAITEKLHHTAMAIVKALGAGASKERFYAYHMACSLVGAGIARKLGWISFDLGALKQWAFRHILKMRATSSEFNQTIDDQFSAFLSDIYGRILITKGFDTLNVKSGKTEVPFKELRGAPVARLALGNDLERGKMYIATRALMAWCKEQGLNGLQFKRRLETSKLVRRPPGSTRVDVEVSLARGVPTMPSGKSRCIEVDLARLQGFIDEVTSGKVVDINEARAAGATDEAAAATQGA